MRNIKRLVLILSLFSVCGLYAGYTTEYKFNNPGDAWWGFNSPGSKMLISIDPNEHFFKLNASMRVDFEYNGPGSWMGVGNETKWNPLRENWTTYGYGGLVIYMKGSDEFPTLITLMTREGTFNITVPVHPYWTKYSIPWGSFTGDNGSYDAFSIDMPRYEIRAGQNDMEGAHTLWINEIGFEDNTIKLKQADAFHIAGIVTAKDGSALNNAKIVIQHDLDGVNGLLTVDEFHPNGSGHFSRAFAYQQYMPYSEKALTASASAMTNSSKTVKQPFDMTYYVRADAEGYLGDLQVLDITSPEQLKNIKFALEPVEKDTIKIDINNNEIVNKISPLIYGVNAGVWMGSVIQNNPNLIKVCKDMGITVVRFPGGGQSQRELWNRQGYPWYQKPPDQPGVPPGWYRNALPSGDMDGFVKFCKEIGAEPLISIDIQSHTLDIAADEVHYCNIEKKYGIKYWEGGNEPEGYQGDAGWEYGRAWGNDPVATAKTYAQVGKYHMEYDKAMKAVDPSIVFLGAVSANMRGREHGGLEAFLNVVKDKCDGIAFHIYPDTTSDEQFLGQPAEWTNYNYILHRYLVPGYKPIYACDEWNYTAQGMGPRTWSLPCGLWGAKWIFEMINYGVDIGCFWDLIENDFQTILRLQGKAVITSYLTETFRILSHNFLGQMVKSGSSNPLVSAYAAVNDGNLVVAVVNTSPSVAYNADLSIVKDEFSDDFTGCCMTETKPYEEISGTIKGKKGYMFKAYSLTLLKFPLKKK